MRSPTLPHSIIVGLMASTTTTTTTTKTRPPIHHLTMLDKHQKMTVAEIKAELELRGVDTAQYLEKSELLDALERARTNGAADPALLDAFNKQAAERMYQGESKTNDFSVPQEAVAADGTLPGGLDPATIASLASDPEVMALLQNPRMQEVLRDIMTNGARRAQEVRRRRGGARDAEESGRPPRVG